MLIDTDVKLDFNDVLIKPKRSVLNSRADIELLKTHKFKYASDSWHGLPIIASNMTCTGTIPMSLVLKEHGMVTCLHKFHVPTPQTAKHLGPLVWATIGMEEEGINRLKSLEKSTAHALFIAIDVANGYTENFVEWCSSVREQFPNSFIMAGNVCTAEMVQELVINGLVDCVKIGIGPGSVCRTRMVTGVGYPQLSAIIECADVAHGLGAHVCADGGIKEIGDIVKAFGAGADFVMVGGLFSGFEENEGVWEREQEVIFSADKPPVATGKWIKKSMKFYGMASKYAMENYAGGQKEYRAAEGEEIVVPYKGGIEQFLTEIEGGLRSACTYIGASCLKDLPKCCTFIRVNRTK
jgi:GMP reductase